MKVSFVTPTKDRPETLALCRQWVRGQTYPVHEHIVEEGRGRLENLIVALPKVTGDIVIIAEDDDHYSPGWADACVTGLRTVPVFGMYLKRIYHFRQPAYVDTLRAGPCDGTIAFSRDLVPDALALLAKGLPLKKLKRTNNKGETGRQLVTQIRSMNANGYSRIHKYDEEDYPHLDPGRAVLRRWIGDDAVDQYERALEAIDRRLSLQ